MPTIFRKPEADTAYLHEQNQTSFLPYTKLPADAFRAARFQASALAATRPCRKPTNAPCRKPEADTLQTDIAFQRRMLSTSPQRHNMQRPKTAAKQVQISTT